LLIEPSGASFALVKIKFMSQIAFMPISVEQIVEETRHWPPEKVGELLDRLSGDLHAFDKDTEVAWQAEIARRIEDIQSGKVRGIPGEEVSARIRKIVGR